MRLGRGVTLPSGSVVELRHMPFPVEFIAYPMQTKPGWWRIKVMYVGRDRESNGKTRFWGGSFVDVLRPGGKPPTTRRLATLLRETLKRGLSHEVDECIYVNGRRAFDPHRRGAGR